MANKSWDWTMMNKNQYGNLPIEVKLAQLVEERKKHFPQLSRGVSNFLSQFYKILNELSDVKDAKSRKALAFALCNEKMEKATKIKRLEPVCSYVQNVIQTNLKVYVGNIR